MSDLGLSAAAHPAFNALGDPWPEEDQNDNSQEECDQSEMFLGCFRQAHADREDHTRILEGLADLGDDT
jgi:hypothetical protein